VYLTEVSLFAPHWIYHLPQCASDRVTESQNGLACKGPLEVILSNPLTQAGPPRAGCQGCVQMAFEYLQGWRLHNLPGQPVPVLGHPLSKKVFPDVQWECPGFQSVPIAFGLSLGTTEQSLALSSLHPPCRYLCTLMRSPRAFSSPVPSLSASPHRRDAPVPSSSLQPLAGLYPVCPWLSCTETSGILFQTICKV